MKDNIKNILLCELFSANNYIERLFHGMIDITSLGVVPEGQKVSSRLHFDLMQYIETGALKDSFTSSDLKVMGPKEVRAALKSANSMTESMIKLNFNQSVMIEYTVGLINLLYSYAKEMHETINEMTDLTVQFPRLNLATTQYDESELDLIKKEMGDNIQDELQAELDEEYGEEFTIEDNENVPLFALDKEVIEKFSNEQIGSISSLEWQREKKYQDLIHEGHEAIFAKEHEHALVKFTKALNYKETAEILTLIGWAHSLLENLEDAKSFCLKAIQKDPDYGPPYNDLGSYLLNEGQINESLKWFDLAKKAVKYQNREYPYINSGRAYMTLKKLPEALEEFSKALTLAPYHEELHNTVEKLKGSIHKASDKQNDSEIEDEIPPSVFD